jgi:Na+-transporting NADH:ubiquinone oxidoreductase subunit A
MVHIKISKGLDIPIKGAPAGNVQTLVRSGESQPQGPLKIALDLKPFEDIKFRLLIKPDDIVKIGQPLAEDKASPGRFFVSPASGTVAEIKRGAKRVLQEIIIQVSPQEESVVLTPLNPQQATREQLVIRLLEGGMFAFIRQRPFNRVADPNKIPRAIFVKAIESAPFTPPAEIQVEGHEKDFQTGLDALAKLTSGNVHLVHRNHSGSKAFTHAQNVTIHTAEGPHPIANQSLHIQQISPIKSVEDVIWTVNTRDVILIGHLLNTGMYLTERVISIAGPAILEDRSGYFRLRQGYPVNSLISNRLQKGLVRLISGDPLMGNQVKNDDFLGFYDSVFCAIKENTQREFLHFFRLGSHKFTATGTYLSKLFGRNREFDFTTNQHGEHRAFIDSSMYDKVQPLHVPTMLLVKAVMAEDYELADTYGLVEVDSEDFALPTFVDPSKTQMTEIIKNGLKNYAKEVLA